MGKILANPPLTNMNTQRFYPPMYWNSEVGFLKYNTSSVYKDNKKSLTPTDRS